MAMSILGSPRVINCLTTFVTASSIAVANLTCQCEMGWQPGYGLPGASRSVECSVLWDPDGPGPAQPRLAVGGSFFAIGQAASHGVASFDASAATFTSLGSGVQRTTNPLATFPIVRSISGLPNGDLVVVGLFDLVGSTPTNGIARWDGHGWHPMDQNVNNPHLVFTARNGTIYLAGDITAGGIRTQGLARWTGTTWHPFATTDLAITCLAESPSGDLIAGGSFTTWNGAPSAALMRWDGNNWSPLLPVAIDRISAMQNLANGDLLVAGRSTISPSQQSLARFDGNAWYMVPGAVTPGPIQAIAELPNGDIIVAGDFSLIAGQAIQGIARWNGTAWTGLGGARNTIRTLQILPTGELFAGGEFSAIGNTEALNAAIWNGTSWRALPGQLHKQIEVMKAMSNGDLVVAGQFRDMLNIPAVGIARRTGSTWSNLGSGFLTPAGGIGYVRALAEMPNGDVLAGGSFLHAGGSPIASIARWDGTAWHPVGTGLRGQVMAIQVTPAGEIIVAGDLSISPSFNIVRIARWNGTNWSQMGGDVISSTSNGSVNALATLPNGEVVACGNFSQIGAVAANNIARWDGSMWRPMGAGFQGLGAALAVLPDGQLMAAWNPLWGGSGNQMARWNGTSWQVVPQSQIGPPVFGGIRGMVALPNGDVVIYGWFTSVGNMPASYIARWNGSQWSTLGHGLNARIRSNSYGFAWTAAFEQSGRLGVGGDFITAGEYASDGLAYFAATCPAQAIEIGTGCTGSAGRNHLTARTWPYLGGVFDTVTRGLPTPSIASSVWSFQPSPQTTPLSLLHPNGLAGCDLLMNPDFGKLQWVTDATATTREAIPNHIALVGVTFLQQTLTLEVDAHGTLLAIASSNALSLTVGSL